MKAVVRVAWTLMQLVFRSEELCSKNCIVKNPKIHFDHLKCVCWVWYLRTH